ncbi:hypothetical protein NC653_032792 [Populus alba x Populus x berolinensis]|uniref:Uncharacterized protein n=1 Tax=Populus alba x Populus x berolinensis TaxID=444605 RepID=A0AAD6Q075_9ROSI|nr:hypothetical protein NC653_032792 [Populus alba x Populus x berolinensis]
MILFLNYLSQKQMSDEKSLQNNKLLRTCLDV